MLLYSEINREIPGNPSKPRVSRKSPSIFGYAMPKHTPNHFKLFSTFPIFSYTIPENTFTLWLIESFTYLIKRKSNAAKEMPASFPRRTAMTQLKNANQNQYGNIN